MYMHVHACTQYTDIVREPHLALKKHTVIKHYFFPITEVKQNQLLYYLIQ